jgi:DNA polymerase-3 subunit gamma/tau
MATQSLYRRYRPRRFAEVKGQEHVVRALRNAVINHREGQAYLFSGPRGTGKTTSARILAKVLNCEQPIDGEPCCECESCVAVERGTSYDVHELDAASNNGVDAIRDIIEKASLGTPGRHKVYILDEVHMLSKGAEAALLKTLEEPPPHVVFVLATTDPQKVSDTIRSRTQHLQFHLLPMDVMEDHLKWLAGDAGIDLTDDALQSVLRQGGGSARDTISALELVASGGGEPLEATPLDEFVEAFISHDPGRALAVVAHAVQLGRSPRTLSDDIVRHLRDCFLSLMAPELVQLPAQRAEEVSALAQRLGAAAIVRAMERLGEVLVEMRHAPDPRVLLEVALVQLTHEASSVDVAVLLERIERLEHQVATGVQPAASRPVPIDPATGRAALGGRARREPAPAPAAPVAPAAAAPTGPPAGESAPPAAPPPPSPPPSTASDAAGSAQAAGRAAAMWSTDLLPALRGMARAQFATVRVLGERDGTLAIGVSKEATRDKCARYLVEVEQAIAAALGERVKVTLVVTGDAEVDPSGGLQRPSLRAEQPVASGGASGPGHANAVDDHPGIDDIDDIGDIADLDDVPPDQVATPENMLKEFFPGSSVIEER